MKTRVLIVDDDPTNILIVREMLELEDCFVCDVAENGAAAFARMEESCPDIVLLDVMMPNENGYEVCRRIKSHIAFRAVKVIMVTGMAMESDRQACFNAGADGYLAKPFEDTELFNILQSHLRTAASSDGTGR